jgi:hypothetical protein
MSDMRNKIPGIDEAVTAREVEKQKKASMVSFKNNLDEMKNNPDKEDNEEMEGGGIVGKNI